MLSVNKSNLKKLSCGILLALSLSTGCSLVSDHNANLQPEAFGTLTHDSSWYEQQVSESSPEFTYDWQILLARAYTVEGDFYKAKDIISQLRKNAVTPLQGNKADIAEAQINIRQGKYREAYSLLSAVNTMSLSNADSAYYNLSIAKTEEALGKNTDAAQHYIALSNIVTSAADKNDAISRTLIALSKSNKNDLIKGFKNSKTPYEKGFFEYALISQTKNEKTKQILLTKLAKKYPDHPVLAMQKNNNSQNATTVASTTPVENLNKIAVFLPLTGKYAELVGIATKLGIENSLKANAFNYEITYYDTNNKSISDLYAQAKADNASLILGPIIKEEVDALLKLNPSIPVISYNEGQVKNYPNAYALTLSPEIDLNSTANKIIADGHKSPMIIAPNNAKGQRVATIFNSSWYKLNNRNVNACYFNDINSLENTLKDCYNKAANTDAVYVYGTANEASVIREYSKIVTSSNMPFYIGQHSNNGVLNSAVLNSIQGMQLGDEPWLINESDAKNEIIATLPKANGDTLRCFAIGYDSLVVANQLNNLVNNPQSKINGLSGNIYINQGKLEREISWIQIGAEQ